MKILKIIGSTTFFLALLSTTTFAQNSEERSVDTFNEVKVSQAINCYLKEGTTEKVRVEVDGIDLDDVITEVSGSRLLIHLERGNFRNVHVKDGLLY